VTSTGYLTTIVALSVFMLGTVVTLTIYVANRLDRRLVTVEQALATLDESMRGMSPKVAPRQDGPPQP
jgi:hypothetical protein